MDNENERPNSIKHAKIGNLDNDSKEPWKTEVLPLVKEDWNASNGLYTAIKEKHVSSKNKRLKAIIQPQS